MTQLILLSKFKKASLTQNKSKFHKQLVKRFSQCRKKLMRIFGFRWIHSSEILVFWRFDHPYFIVLFAQKYSSIYYLTPGPDKIETYSQEQLTKFLKVFKRNYILDNVQLVDNFFWFVYTLSLLNCDSYPGG